MDKNRLKLTTIYALIILIFLIVILPIYFCIGDFTWHWIIFGLIILLIPYAVIHFALDIVLKNDLSKEQKKQVSIKTVLLIFFYWLADCFYMVMFNDWLMWIYIIGVILISIIFCNLAKTFVHKKGKISNIFLIIDLMIGIGLTICLIYRIPNDFENLQTIITNIIAAVYGGLLTLVGVAWTIKKGESNRNEDLTRRDKEKKEEEKAKARPLFTFNYFTEINPKVNHRKVCFITDVNIGVVSYIELENSNATSFKIKRFYFDNAWHEAQANNNVLPGNILLIQLVRKNLLEHVYMEITDIFDNKYYYDMMFVGLPSPLNPICYTLGELKEISENVLESRSILIKEQGE